MQIVYLDALDCTDQKVKNGRRFMLFQCMWSEFQCAFCSTSDSNTEISNKNEGHANSVYKGGLISNIVSISGRWSAAEEQMPLNQQTIMQTAVNKTKHLISALYS